VPSQANGPYDGFPSLRPVERQRLLLSNAEDFDRVDQVRAESDAILIGRNTLRSDNPRLLVNSEKRRADRVTAESPPTR
jgi:riboflavin biosynthesis pyrimidine reductase